MHKVIFAAALAARTDRSADVRNSSRSAAAQQQASTDKNAKTKKSRALVSSRRASGRRSAEPSGRKRRPATKSRKERPGQNSGAPATSVSSPLPSNVQSLLQGAHAEPAQHKTTEGVGETEISPTPSVSSEPGRRGQPHCADHTMAHTGPYDAISDT